jgi:hypothetical protein
MAGVGVGDRRREKDERKTSLTAREGRAAVTDVQRLSAWQPVMSGKRGGDSGVCWAILNQEASLWSRLSLKTVAYFGESLSFIWASVSPSMK